jgi:4-hydroxy-4-methyl-2-oxoglutarate aldolase
MERMCGQRREGGLDMKRMVGILDSSKVRIDEVRRPSAEIVRGYQELPDVAGVVARALDQFGIAGTIPSIRLKPLRPGGVVVGPAITVRNIPEREVPYRYWARNAPTLLGEKEAFFLAQSGDVVVIDGSAVYPASCLGPLAARLASQLGLAGIVVSGAATGVAAIKAVDLPVWARGGTTITGHHRVETIEINGPIGIEGVRVEPGDLVIGDDSGITIVPLTIAEQVLECAQTRKQMGSALRLSLEEGADRETLRSQLGELMVELMRGSTDASRQDQ